MNPSGENDVFPESLCKHKIIQKLLQENYSEIIVFRSMKCFSYNRQDFPT